MQKNEQNGKMMEISMLSVVGEERGTVTHIYPKLKIIAISMIQLDCVCYDANCDSKKKL